MEGGQAIRLAGASDGKVVGSHPILGFVNIGSTTASAVLEIYDGTSTTGTKVARIDASSANARAFQYQIRCEAGVYAVLTGGGDATVTVF